MNLLDKVLYKTGKPLSRLFVSGDTMEDALIVAKELNEQGLEAIINFLGEEVKSRDQAFEAIRVYAQLIWEVRTRGIRARVSVKPSQLGFKIDRQFYSDRLEYVAREAFLFKVPLEIDIETEDTVLETVEATIKLAKERPGLNIRQALSMNFKNIFPHLYNLTGSGVKVRLCKGAYPSDPPKYNEKEIADRYLSAAVYLFQRRAEPDFATHDLELLSRIHLSRWRYEAICGFQFLFGLRRRTWKELVEKNMRVAIYVPFGTNWLPYAKRRWKYVAKNIPSIICGN